MKALIMVLCLCCIACAKPQGKQPSTVIVIGDSTVFTNTDARSLQGWGYYLEQYFDPTKATYINAAKSGRSSKSFYHEAWQEVLSQKPKFILIQFGLNDAKTDAYRHTDPQSSFKEYLRKYYNEAKAIGAEVIFVTSPERTLNNSCVLTEDVLPYVDAMKEVAMELNASVIDLHASNARWITGICPSFSKYFVDTVHTTYEGAAVNAGFVYEQFPQQLFHLTK